MPSPVAPAKKDDKQTSESLMVELDQLGDELEGLRVAYEQYFLGMERRPPVQRHERLKRGVVALQTTTVKQTAVKFKAQALHAKLLTYERMWSRTLQEIEDGVYKRDLFKARLHRHEREEKERLKDPDKQSEPEAAPPPAAAAQPPPPPPPSGPGVRISAPRPSSPASAQLSDAKIRAIYDAYVTAKRRCNEDTSKLSFDSVANTLRQQVPVLMKQHNAKSVEFKVVIKDGKAVLRALPKE